MRTIHLYLVLAILCCASAYAEGLVGTQADTITVAPHKAIEITAAIDVGDSEAIVFWQLPEGIDYREVGDGLTIHCWAPPGTYPIVAAAMVVDWEAKKVRKVQYRCLLTVEGAVVDPVKPPPVVVTPTTKATRVTYVYEKDDTAIPGPVAAALQRINAEHPGILASEFEDDTVNGDGGIPDQYRLALEVARKAGLPVLVIQSGDVVTKVIAAPTTEAEVMEAIK